MTNETSINTIPNKRYIDLVVAGPDFSGTTTQIKDMIAYLKNKNLRVRDLRGTENDALFHAEKFSDLNHGYTSLNEFLDDKNTTQNSKYYFLEEAHNLLSGRNNDSDLLVASMVKNDCTTYINPDSADVWILEEPTRRSAGQMSRVIEQNRSKFGSHLDAYSAALTHQAYRTDEFFRFRKPLRDAGKTIFRSRSEESACYQIYDLEHISSGIELDDYLNLPGHRIAFATPPTDIFIVCGPVNWNKDAYLKLKSERKGRRVLDDHENDSEYQLLVNQRYATDWIDNVYIKGCAYYGSTVPKIHRLDIYHSIADTKNEMNGLLEKILK